MQGAGVKVRRGVPNTTPPARGQCHHIHAQHCARMHRQGDNIQLLKGPAGTLKASRTALREMKIYLARLHPATQTRGNTYAAILAKLCQKYRKVKKILYTA